MPLYSGARRLRRHPRERIPVFYTPLGNRVSIRRGATTPRSRRSRNFSGNLIRSQRTNQEAAGAKIFQEFLEHGEANLCICSGVIEHFAVRR